MRINYCNLDCYKCSYLGNCVIQKEREKEQSLTIPYKTEQNQTIYVKDKK